jgi:hypothetical protein
MYKQSKNKKIRGHPDLPYALVLYRVSVTKRAMGVNVGAPAAGKEKRAPFS